MDPVELLKKHRKVINGVPYICEKLLDHFKDEKSLLDRHKSRFVDQHLSQLLAGTSTTNATVMKFEKSGRSQEILIEEPYMNLIILRGGKQLPWTDSRREYVRHFFGENVIPPCTMNSQFPRFSLPRSEIEAPQSLTQTEIEAPQSPPQTEALPRPEKRSRSSMQRDIFIDTKVSKAWEKDPAQFWKDVLSFSRRKNLPFRLVIQHIISLCKSESRKKRLTGSRYAKTIVKELFISRGEIDDFRSKLAIQKKTGNSEELLNFVRNRLRIPALKENIIPSRTSTQPAIAKLYQYFAKLCKPETTATGFRIDLVSTVRLATYLRFGLKDINGVVIDIWGDGCEIGKKEVTRLCFRIISPMDNVSVQTSSGVYCFVAYYGKDSRFGLEENIGWTTAGDQTTGWLYQQTRALIEDFGVSIVYSGDSPFILRLILGKSNDTSGKSFMPIYVSDDHDFPPNKVHEATHRRMDLQIPFRQQIPRSSLVYMRDITSVCPDVMHLIIRLVENDLRRVAQLLTNQTRPYDEHPVHILEHRLSEREVETTAQYGQGFTFTIKRTSRGATVEPVKLSGQKAISVIADKSAFDDTGRNISNLYEGVWYGELYPKTNTRPIQVIKSLGHEAMFAENDTVTYENLCELLRKSLYQCFLLLRDPHSFNAERFKIEAETYYQVSLMLFGEEITPYKVKLMIFPQLIERGIITLPYNHMAEVTEKSNHDAQRRYSMKTMRGGGQVHNHDPTYLDMFFCFCEQLRSKSVNLPCLMDACHRVIYGNFIPTDFTTAPRYSDICRKLPKLSTLDLGKKTVYPLSGFKFLFLGYFDHIKHTQSQLEEITERLGGTVFTNAQAFRIMRIHSQTPNCFCVLQDATELNSGLRMTNETSTRTKKKKQTAVISRIALRCLHIAGSNFKFLNVEYLLHVQHSMTVEDPTPYLLSTSGGHILKRNADNNRYLFKIQRLNRDVELNPKTTSAIASIRRAHKRLRERQMEERKKEQN